eukprot:TRINITY_DN4923_c0_g1_i1.p1 TRINITY_DN4923_c0_g1~~TRINITY_DN4923_c0_g1_i1.p1  ORF type:complete len:152 (-),score=49.16 TRINITY_DN4923_c0_g1_i1:95-529(-)
MAAAPGGLDAELKRMNELITAFRTDVLVPAQKEVQQLQKAEGRCRCETHARCPNPACGAAPCPPYHLYNCGHCFCIFCMSEQIAAGRENHCPHEGCHKLIAEPDVARIVFLRGLVRSSGRPTAQLQERLHCNYGHYSPKDAACC